MKDGHIPGNAWLWDYLGSLNYFQLDNAALDLPYLIIACWGVVLLVAVLGEQVWRMAYEKRRPSTDFATNISLFFIGSAVKSVVTSALMLLMLVYFYSLSPWQIDTGPLLIVALWLVSDFSYCWHHRLGHRSRILWADHQQHHSSSELDFSTNLRRPFLAETYKWFPLCFFCLLGVDPIVMFIVFRATAAWQVWCHNDRIGRLGWVDSVFNTPSNHRVHHSSNPLYIDKNYGAFLMLWDKLFGTYQAEREDTPPVFGLSKPLATRNPFKVIAAGYLELAKSTRQTAGFFNRIKHLLFAPTNKAKPGG